MTAHSMLREEHANPVPGENLRNLPLSIEFLFYADCPSHERALKLLRDVLADEDLPANIAIHEVTSDAEAEKIRFPGSPTIRVNGHDIEDNPGAPIGLSCRAYRDAGGKLGPLPPRELIERAVRQAARDPQLTNPAMDPR